MQFYVSTQISATLVIKFNFGRSEPPEGIRCRSSEYRRFIYLFRRSAASGLSFRHCSPISVRTLRSGQQKLASFWRGISPAPHRHGVVNSTLWARLNFEHLKRSRGQTSQGQGDHSFKTSRVALPFSYNVYATVHRFKSILKNCKHAQL